MKKRLLFTDKHYYKMLRKFYHYRERMRTLITGGLFFQLPTWERLQMVKKLQLLFKRLSKVNRGARLKIAGTTAAFAMLTSMAMAQGPFEQITGNDNPLGGMVNPFGNLVDVKTVSPVMVDINADGNKDLFVGDTLGNIHYFKNTGDLTFEEQTGGYNPLDGVNVGNNAKPAFVDIDGDGDYDLFIGNKDGNISYYKNITDDVHVPVFEEQTGAANPFDGLITGSNNVSPAFVDIDGDGDYDAFVGTKYGNILAFENNGSEIAPDFVALAGPDNPLGDVMVNYGTLSFADLDNDGDYDMVAGSKYGQLVQYNNTGTANAAVFEEVATEDSYFAKVEPGQLYTPDFVDVDGDTDMDMVIGSQIGYIKYLNNEGTVSSPDFVAYEPIDVGYQAHPAFVDIDGDGDYDAFAGSYIGDIKYFRNEGDANNPDFQEMFGMDNPFDGDTIQYTPSLDFVDIDDDGDFDMFAGDQDGSIHYFKNNGNANTPNFFEQTGAENNPFDGVTGAEMANIKFVDIDGDGDQDAFIGATDGQLRYFMNNGDHQVPIFVEKTGNNNPAAVVQMSGNPVSPAFVDVDADGDYDLFVGGKYGALAYYENTGTAQAAVFEQRTGTDNPLGDLSIAMPVPAFVDIDGDTDPDLFIGNMYGNIFFYQNNAATTSVHMFTESTLKLYPNPGQGYVNLKIDKLQPGDLAIRVSNISGQQVYQRTFSTNGSFEESFDLSSLGSGIYILQMKNGDNVAVRKFVIRK